MPKTEAKNWLKNGFEKDLEMVPKRFQKGFRKV